MSLLEYQECIALFWTKTSCVYGVRVQIKNHKLSLVDSVAFEMEDGSFSTAFTKASEKLMQPTTHLIVAGGSIAGSVCFDLSVPQMAISDIKQAIQYELPRHMPCDPSEITFGYRILNQQAVAEGPAKMLIRIFAVLKKEWNELITEFTTSEVKIDSFLSPNMVLDPLLQEIDELYVPDIDEDFKYVRINDSRLRQMVKVKDKVANPKIKPEGSELLNLLNYEEVHGDVREHLDHFIAPMILAAYGLSSDFRDGKNQMVPLPKEMVPERFRRLRISFFIFLFSCLLLMLGLGGRYWWDSWSRLRSLQNEIKVVKAKAKKVKQTNSKLTQIDELINELEKADVGNDEISNSLYILSKVIPKTMWLAYYSTRGIGMDLSIRAPAGQQSKLVTVLDKTGIFKVKNSYTKRNSDNTENIYVHLEFLNVKAPKEER